LKLKDDLRVDNVGFVIDLINHGGHMKIVEKKERKSNAKRGNGAQWIFRGRSRSILSPTDD